MKSLSLGAAALALCLVPLAPSSAEEAAAPAVRTFQFTYAVTIPKPAEGSKRLDAWIPLPAEDELQKVEDLKVVATSGGKDLKVDQGKDATYGNRIAHVGVDAPTTEVAFSWTAKITRTEDRGQGK